MQFGDQGIVNTVQMAGQLFCAALGTKFLQQAFRERGETGYVGKQSSAVGFAGQRLAPQNGLPSIHGNVSAGSFHCSFFCLPLNLYTLLCHECDE